MKSAILELSLLPQYTQFANPSTPHTLHGGNAMSNWRNNKSQVPGPRICTDVLFLMFAFVTILTLATLSKAQSSTGSFPGPAIREGNRSMDDYDRTINRMKNDAKAINERRRNLFPQIDEDFKRIQ